ncbi:MAG: hypothetical protein ACUVR3_00955, partial [Candidatus Roseilinea sp.]|uniref:hypothetical protein n=1 Tax=Candidatus Roseilinea sp. TaxID=2838777 RepID=UPI00404A3CFE
RPGVFCLGIDSFIISVIAFFFNLLIMRSPRPAGVRAALCVGIFMGTWAAILVFRIALGMALGQGQS